MGYVPTICFDVLDELFKLCYTFALSNSLMISKHFFELYLFVLPNVMYAKLYV